jgi:tRNA threonylcarbamoyladenosine biosynthesis protein TsaB
VIVLAAETSTDRGSVALLDDERLLAEVELELGKGHSENLLRMADAVLGLAGKKLKDVEQLCVGLGPGSFTGVRIGVVTLRMLGYALGVPVAGVSTLEALCGPWLDEEALLMPTLDAHRGQVYTAVLRASRGRLVRERDDAALFPAEFAERERELGEHEPVVVLGPGWQRYQAALGEPPRGIRRVPGATPRASGVARCALRSELKLPPEQRRAVAPNYVRHSDAELGIRPAARGNRA